jgi:hypothetical protein
VEQHVVQVAVGGAEHEQLDDGRSEPIGRRARPVANAVADLVERALTA